MFTGIGWTASRAAVINSSGELTAAVGNATDCVLQDGSTAAKANASHTHAQSDVTNLVTDLAGKAASVHAHTSSQISDATAAASASTVVLRDGWAGANFGYVAANNLWAYLDSHFQSVECGAFQTVGGAFENMAKYSEDFSVGTWDKNGGSCSVTANSTTAPDGNTTADTVTASTATPMIQQQIAGLVSGGQYTFYVWAKAPSGTKQVSIAIVDNAYAAYLAGPTSISLTKSWQRFKITGTLAGGQAGLWIVVRQFVSNGDNWTSGDIHVWGACLQQGNDPKKAYARTWGYQASPVAAGVACGPMLVVAKDSTESPFRVAGPGSNLADHTLLQVTAGGELIIAGSSGNGYRFAELMGASNPSGWSGVIKVKNPAGATAGIGQVDHAKRNMRPELSGNFSRSAPPGGVAVEHQDQTPEMPQQSAAGQRRQQRAVALSAEGGRIRRRQQPLQFGEREPAARSRAPRRDGPPRKSQSLEVEKPARWRWPDTSSANGRSSRAYEMKTIILPQPTFDNLYFEISNETSTRRKEPELAKAQVEWHVALARHIREVESGLAKRHLIAANAHQRILKYVENGQEFTETGDAAYFDEPSVDIINYHYISRKAPGKGLAAIDSGPARAGLTSAFFKARRHVRKPIVFDENYAGVVRGAPADWDRNRMEAWETILSGGAGFDHLDWSFTPQDPTGSGKEPIGDGRRLYGRALRAQLGRLANLWRECGPERMRPDDDLIASSPENTRAFASTRSDGRLHVIYVADARQDGLGSATGGRLRLRLADGAYGVRSLPSGALAWKALAPVKAGKPVTEIDLPRFEKDCALVLEKSDRL
jgi:hypothetical protein